MNARVLSTPVYRVTIPTMSTETLASLIRTRREALGLSQIGLAHAIGTSSAYMSQIEKGRSNWPQNLIVPLSKALGVSEVEMAIAAGLLSPDAATQDRHNNPFAPDDLRWQLVEKLKRLTMDAPGAEFTVKSMGQLIDLYFNEPELYAQSTEISAKPLDLSTHTREDSTNH